MAHPEDDCVFCEIVQRDPHGQIEQRMGHSVVFTPLNALPGHKLVVPNVHVRDAAECPEVTANVFADAVTYARGLGCDFNIITSAGASATQTVFHLHVHVVPRHEGDGLNIPWGGSRKK